MRRRLLHAAAGVAAALLVAALLMLVQGRNPVEAYGALLRFSLASPAGLAATLRSSVPLVLTGLSASLAFASGPINLGQPGQLVVGALFATAGGLALDLPAAIEIPALLAMGCVGGALWAAVPALLGRYAGMSEFIVTLMLNMIADSLTAWAVTYPLMDPEAYSPMTRPIASGGWLPRIAGMDTGVIVMLAAVGLVWLVWARSRVGYEWRMGGMNRLFARLGGCRVDRNFVLVMLWSGALAGLAGGLLVMGGPHRFIKGIGGGYAWDGVMIAMVSANGIAATLAYGLFFGALRAGALGMELVTALPSELIVVLQAVIVLTVVAAREVLTSGVDRAMALRRARVRQP
jgi:simple sugar transport system permease protein